MGLIEESTRSYFKRFDGVEPITLKRGIENL